VIAAISGVSSWLGHDEAFEVHSDCLPVALEDEIDARPHRTHHMVLNNIARQAHARHVTNTQQPIANFHLAR